MEMLESAMAFAVAMVIFSTIVTGIVEILLRAVGTREKHLRKTVESLFDTVIWPRLKNSLTPPGTDPEADAMHKQRSRFVHAMVGNPAAGAASIDADQKAKWWPGERIDAFKAGRPGKQIDALSTMAFAERLGRTEIGKSILAEGEEHIDLLVNDFVRTFDRYGRAASEIFRKKAQLTAIVIGIVFAFAANIDAGRLFTTLIENPSLRTNLIAQAEEAAKANDEARASLEKIEQSVKDGSLKAEQADILKQQAMKLIASVQKIEKQGLPIGSKYFPYCSSEKKTGLCIAVGDKNFIQIFRVHTRDTIRWIMLTILAGILIGLGGPFWFRVFNGLSQVAQMLRAVGLGKKSSPSEAAGTPPVTAAEASAKPNNVKDAFKVAAAVTHGSADSSRIIAHWP